MPSWQDQVYNGASVWCLEHGNGQVTYIDRYHKLVYVDYYDNGRHTHDLDIFDGSYDERLNQFVVVPF